MEPAGKKAWDASVAFDAREPSTVNRQPSNPSTQPESQRPETASRDLQRSMSSPRTSCKYNTTCV
eukprot:1508899-Rhodomonas_salina.3